MNITVATVHQSENDQNVKFTLTDSEGIEYRYHADIPLNVDPQEYLTTHINEMYACIMREQYKEAPTLSTPEEWAAWIAAGRQLVYVVVVPKTEFRHTWQVS